MKNTHRKHLNSLLENVLGFFTLPKQPTKKAELYWVIQEDDPFTVKYFNACNQLIHTENFPEIQKGFLDNETIRKLNRVKCEFQQKLSTRKTK